MKTFAPLPGSPPVMRIPEHCFAEMDFLRPCALKRGSGRRYENVTGLGKRMLAKARRHIRELGFLRERCGYAKHPVEACLRLPITNVFKVEIKSIAGKHMLPKLWKRTGTGTYCFDE